MRKFLRMLLVGLCIISFVAGCGSVASEDKPIADVKAESKEMSPDQLEGVVNNYKKAIEDKKGQIEKIKEKLSKIPLAKMLGDEAKVLQNDVSKVSTSIRDLTERMNIYSRELAVKLK